MVYLPVGAAEYRSASLRSAPTGETRTRKPFALEKRSYKAGRKEKCHTREEHKLAIKHRLDKRYRQTPLFNQRGRIQRIKQGKQ